MMGMSDQEHEIIERTVRELDSRPYKTQGDVWQFICSVDLKRLMRRRGVDLSKLPRKAYRKFRKKASYFIMGPRRPDQEIVQLFSMDENPAQRMYVTMCALVERQIHRGHLPLRPGYEPMPCSDNGCVLGCNAKFANDLVQLHLP